MHQLPLLDLHGGTCACLQQVDNMPQSEQVQLKRYFCGAGDILYYLSFAIALGQEGWIAMHFTLCPFCAAQGRSACSASLGLWGTYFLEVGCT